MSDPDAPDRETLACRPFGIAAFEPELGAVFAPLPAAPIARAPAYG